MSASYEAIFPSLRTAAPASAPPPEWQSPASVASGAAPADDSFAHDVMEILNPLQHIPIVSTIYRQMSGDKIGPMERIAGDTLYGGVLGLASSVANIAFEKLTGKDFGDTALAMLGINQDKPSAVAANAQAPAAPARVADATPAQLIPISAKPDLSLSPQTDALNSQDIALMNSLDRNGVGLNLGSPTPASISALDDTKPNEFLASLNRNGTGLDLGSVASTAAPITPLMPATTKTAAASDANADSLMASLSHDGIAPDLALRAMYAYRKSLAAPAGGGSTATTLH